MEEHRLHEDSADITGINVTPLVDVSLVLVLIFMVTSPFFVKPLLPVTLPKATTSETEDNQNITISVSPEEGFAVNEIPIRKEALPLEIRNQMKKSGFSFVLIRADERVPYGEIQDIMKIAKDLGVKRTAFATFPKDH